MISIKAKKLFSYLNPFEDILPGQNNLFNKEAIKNHLLRSDIYHVEGDDDFSNNYRKIAYLVSHPENLFVKINIPTNESNLKDMLVVENDNIFSFVALAFLKPDSILVDLAGDKKFAKTFFGVSQKEDFSFTKEALIVNNKVQEVDWTINENLLIETWRDKEFVLKNIDSSNIHINHKLIPEEFWDDKEFFEGMLKKVDKYSQKDTNIFNFLIKNHQYNPFMIDYVFDNFNSFKLFKEYYFKDYLEYKKGNTVHPNQSLIKDYINNYSTFSKWIRNMYNEEIISHCFDESMWQNQETVVEWFKAKISGSDTDFNPILVDKYSIDKKLRPWVLNQSQEWRTELFDSLVDTYLEYKQKNSSYREQGFDFSVNSLVFNQSFDSQTFFEKIQQCYSMKQGVYMSCFVNFYKNCSIKPEISNDLADLIISYYPNFCHILDEKFKTLDNVKKLVSNRISASVNQLKKFNNKELNLLMIEEGFSSTVMEAFPLSYLLEEDYLLPLIQKKVINLKNKTLCSFIEKNITLVKACIQSGNHQALSPKFFEDKELSAFLVGTVFSEKYKNIHYNFSKESVFSIINPAVLSNIQYLEKILTISSGHFLPKVQHLFKQKEFVQMVFKLYDERKITDTNLLPSEIRLVLDAYKIENNFLNFFNKFDLQSNLHKKLVNNTQTIKSKNKI